MKLTPGQTAVLERLRHAPQTTADWTDAKMPRAVARVCELRAMGFVIRTDYVRRGFYRFTLVSEPSIPHDNLSVSPAAGGLSLAPGGELEKPPSAGNLAAVAEVNEVDARSVTPSPTGHTPEVHDSHRASGGVLFDASPYDQAPVWPDLAA